MYDLVDSSELNSQELRAVLCRLAVMELRRYVFGAFHDNEEDRPIVRLRKLTPPGFNRLCEPCEPCLPAL